MSSHTESSSISVRKYLAEISQIAFSPDGPRVHRTVAESLKTALVPEAEIVTGEAFGKAASRVLRIALSGEPSVIGPSNPPSDRDWMFLRLQTDGSGEMVASRPHLLYTLFCQIRDIWLDADASSFTDGKLIAISISNLTARDDLLTGRKGFLKTGDKQVQFSDIEFSIQEIARLGSSRVIVNELATPFAQERGPEGEVYYRFYDYLPDLDQFVETTFNQGTYPPECLEANLNSLRKFAVLADRYGLIPGLEIANPRSVPESLLRRYPFLRGARIDHPFRCFQPRYTLTLAHPVVRWHYAELLRTILKEVPELGFLTTLVNDSGAGFEYTASLYPGRNGGPYIIREWMPDDAIAKAAADNVIRYYRLLRDVAHESHPKFRIITGLKNIAEESAIIADKIDNCIDLRMITQRSEADTMDWQSELDQFRKKGSDLVTNVSTRGSFYILGVPSPWLTHRNLQSTFDEGFSNVDAMVDPPYLVPHSINREVVRAFQVGPSEDLERTIRNVALKQVGKDSASVLLDIWRLSDRAVEATPVNQQFGGLGFTWYRFWVRPFVPDIGAIPECDRRYYEKHFLSLFNNPHNIDLAADMLWVITSIEQSEKSMQLFDANVWEPLDQAIALSREMVVQLPEQSDARERFVETRDRLIAYRCYSMTLRNIHAWIAGVHGYLKADNEAEKLTKLTMVQEMVTSELENTRALLNLWETSTTNTFPINALGETMHDYGSNFGELLKKKISLTETYGDRLPFIDPNYMWRMPEGSPLNKTDYMSY
ncbi:MAG: hypothetical protein DRP71_06040 [Verrucomicrobia bacterium]|nr:MAG: hypothetical protein DRP71_06040 [Verrucomicrobiota bacterium]